MATGQQKVILRLAGKDGKCRRAVTAGLRWTSRGDAGTEYNFVLSDGMKVVPTSASAQNGVNGPSYVVDRGQLRWRNTGWKVAVEAGRGVRDAL